MKLLKKCYEAVTHKKAPYYYDYSLFTIISKPIRKWCTNVLAANCPFNCIRVLIYKMCGFKIGKRVFIGMRCYLDDMCYDLMCVEDDVTISYGVYFASHGRKQKRAPIIIKSGAYIGMRATIISKTKSGNGVTIGNKAVVGACCLVNKDIPANATAVGIPCRIIDCTPNE